MFANAIKFNQNISNWNVSQVKNITNIFIGANSFDQNINKWDLSNVETNINMEDKHKYQGKYNINESDKTLFLKNKESIKFRKNIFQDYGCL